MAEDLSKFHRPIREPRNHNPISQFQLSDDQVAHFDKYGYVAGIPILNDDEIARLRDELRELTRSDHDGHELWYEYHSNESTDPDFTLFHALGGWRLRSGFHDLLWHPAFTVPASQLLGGAVRFWHDQLFCKPAHHGGVVSWHQDFSYWTRTTPMNHLTCWIGLDDATNDNGCLQYIPGSHQWNLLPITGLAGDMDAIRNVLNDQQWQQLNEPVAIELKAGHASFHHPLMVHGSFANATESQRRAAVINVVKDGVMSTVDEPLLDGTNVIRRGEPLGGQFYPLLFDPSQGDAAQSAKANSA